MSPPFGGQHGPTQDASAGGGMFLITWRIVSEKLGRYWRDDSEKRHLQRLVASRTSQRLVHDPRLRSGRQRNPELAHVTPPLHSANTPRSVGGHRGNYRDVVTAGPAKPSIAA